MLHTGPGDYARAEPLARKAVELDPSSVNYWHTLTDIQLASGGWDCGADSVAQWIRSSKPRFLAESRQEVVRTFQRILEMRNGADLVVILREFGGEHWLHWLDAVERICDPEIRTDPTNEASKIMQELHVKEDAS